LVHNLLPVLPRGVFRALPIQHTLNRPFLTLFRSGHLRGYSSRTERSIDR
jgi:hypothetical protein